MLKDRAHHRVIVFNDKLWILGGQGATDPVWSSVDAKTWQKEAVKYRFSNNKEWKDGFTNQERAHHHVFEFKNKLWLVGGGANDVWSSEDAIHWQLEVAKLPFAVQKDDTFLVRDQQILYIHEGKVAQRSSDGIHWQVPTNIHDAPFAPRSQFYSVVFKDKLWVMGGFRGGMGDMERIAMLSDNWSSADGTKWRQAHDQAALPMPLLHDNMLVFKDKLWIIGTEYLDTMTGAGMRVWSSVDGRTWSNEALNQAIGSRMGASVVVFAGKLWLIGGVVNPMRSSETMNDVWSSEDGVHWTEVIKNAAFSPRAGHRVVVWRDRMWLMGGGEDFADMGAPPTKLQSGIFSSADGITWTQAQQSTVLPEKLADFDLVVFQDKLWVQNVVVEDEHGKPVYLDKVYFTADGITWKEKTRSAGAQFPKVGQHMVQFDNQLWNIGGVADSKDDQGSSAVWKSADGIHWRRSYRGTLTQ